MRSDFGDALGSGAMVGAGHTGFAAEAADGVENALIVGGYNYVVDGLSLLGAFVDALDHRLAGEQDERFAGQARGSVTRGNDHYDSWFVGIHRKIPGDGVPMSMLTQSFGWSGRDASDLGKRRADYCLPWNW